MSRRGAKDAATAYLSYQQKRRALALERQKHARQDKVDAFRSLAQAAMQDAPAGEATDDAMNEDPQQQQQHRHQQPAPTNNRPMRDGSADASGSGRQLPAAADTQLYGMDGINPTHLSGATLKTYFARQLTQPEWMSDTPPDLAGSWLVMPRPEGKRCLVITTRGWTFSRSRTGGLLARFHSRLPGGGPASNSSGPACYCVLDCIYQEQQQQQQQGIPCSNGAAVRQHAAGDAQLMDADMTAVGAPAAGNGSTAAAAAGSDAAPSSSSGTYYIQDVLVWRGYSLVDCGAEFRLFWLRSKLEEEEAGQGGQGGWSLDGGEPGPGHDHRFRFLPCWSATPEGLAAAASAGAGPAVGSTAAAGAAAAAAGSTAGAAAAAAPVLFTQDGVYLRHVEGHYSQGGGSTPLALLWKDESCSRYLLDTDAAGVVPPYQQLVLVYQGPQTAGVATADEPPVVLGRLPQEFVVQMAGKLRAGRLLRFSIREGGILFSSDGSPGGADLAYEGPANQRRGRADLISKVLFQWQARRQPVRLDALLAAAAAAAAAGSSAAGAAAAVCGSVGGAAVSNDQTMMVAEGV